MTFTPPSATAETQNLSVRILAGKSNITISGKFHENLFSNFGFCHTDFHLRPGQSMLTDSILEAER